MKGKILFLMGVVFLMLCSNAYAYANLALNALVTVNSTWSDYYGWKAVDGNYNTLWNAGDVGSASDPNWLIVDLGIMSYIDLIKLVGVYSGLGPYYTTVYNLETSADLLNWIIVDSGTLYDDVDGRFHNISLTEFPMRYAKYEVVGGTHWSNLAEIEIYGTPIPEPASLLLLGSGLLGLAAFGRAKKRKI